MVDNCNIIDTERIKELGNLINNNFSSVNNIESIIENKEIIGYYDNGILIGFLIFKKMYEVIDLLYIVVDPIYRNHGIGSKLMESLFELDYDKIILEVSVSNKNAIKLYKKFNFKIINIRKKYYKNTDAYVMEARK